MKKCRPLRIADGQAAKVRLRLPQSSKYALEQISILLEGLCGITNTNSVSAARALDFYRDHLVWLLERSGQLEQAADSTKMKTKTAGKPATDRQILNLLGDLQDEREALFDSAGRMKDCWKPLYGRVPTAEELVGDSSPNGRAFDKQKVATKILSGLKEISIKLEATNG